MKKKKKKPDSPFVKDCKPSENAKNEMSPLLEQLFYGDIKPGLQKPTPAYQAVVGRISKQEHEISALLGKNKMEIQDISISLICDQYMAWLARRQEMDLEWPASSSPCLPTGVHQDPDASLH